MAACAYNLTRMSPDIQAILVWISKIWLQDGGSLYTTTTEFMFWTVHCKFVTIVSESNKNTFAPLEVNQCEGVYVMFRNLWL